MGKNKRQSRKSGGGFKTFFIGIIFVGVILWVAYRYAPQIERFLEAPTDRWSEWVSQYLTSNAGRQGVAHYETLEIPADFTDTRRHTLCEYEGYTVSYNSEWKIPNWVAYELTRDELNAQVPRKDDFRPDDNLLVAQASPADYRRSGFDRGHMVPAADMRWSATAMSHSFYLTNICPQTPELNRGDWERLESKIRDWARKDSAIVIVCGPLVSPHDTSIGRNGVRVPSAYFKVVVSPYIDTPQGIGFIFANDTEYRKMPLYNYAVTIDSIETLTGIDFFPVLPDDIETSLEACYSVSAWDW
ncbi:MAG: DNA/RNA non-specific endonuclease [Coprobacter sp.]|nr:DNA/RNA non-specific endonuclease [Coprobacter sp.]